MRQPTAGAAFRNPADYSSRMRFHGQAQHAAAEGDVRPATTDWQPKSVNVSAHGSAPVHLDEAFASLDIPELSVKARLLMWITS